VEVLAERTRLSPEVVSEFLRSLDR